LGHPVYNIDRITELYSTNGLTYC